MAMLANGNPARNSTDIRRNSLSTPPCTTPYMAFVVSRPQMPAQTLPSIDATVDAVPRTARPDARRAIRPAV